MLSLLKISQPNWLSHAFWKLPCERWDFLFVTSTNYNILISFSSFFSLFFFSSLKGGFEVLLHEYTQNGGFREPCMGGNKARGKGWGEEGGVQNKLTAAEDWHPPGTLHQCPQEISESSWLIPGNAFPSFLIRFVSLSREQWCSHCRVQFRARKAWQLVSSLTHTQMLEATCPPHLQVQNRFPHLHRHVHE